MKAHMANNPNGNTKPVVLQQFVLDCIPTHAILEYAKANRHIIQESGGCSVFLSHRHPLKEIKGQVWHH